MRKGVIIAIIIAYIASILVVQFFGLQIVGVEGNVYVSEIEIRGFEYVNRAHLTDPKYEIMKKITDLDDEDAIHYAGYFVPGTYDKSEESLASNPNRIKVLYDIFPYNATHANITFDYDTASNDSVIYYDQETQEIVFLKPRTVTFVLNTHDGSKVSVEMQISLL